MTDIIEAQTAASKPATRRSLKMAREPEAMPPAAAQPRVSKSDLVIGLLRREGGATLDDMVVATGWLLHTTRAALTGLKKKGHKVMREKAGGVRRYRIESSEA